MLTKEEAAVPLEQIAELDRKITAEKKAIAEHRNKLLMLELERAKVAKKILQKFPPDSNKLEGEGVTWQRRVNQKVVLHENITVDALPEIFTSKSINRRAIAKAHKQDPKLIESFAAIETTESLTYKVI